MTFAYLKRLCSKNDKVGPVVQGQAYGNAEQSNRIDIKKTTASIYIEQTEMN